MTRPATKVVRVPTARKEREALRGKGQFWTPDWIADVMVAYVLQDSPDEILDPAVGEGAFLRAAKRYAASRGFPLSMYGRDVDPEIVREAKASGLTDEDVQNIEIRDFVLDPPPNQFPAIIANPPYIRHHRLRAEQKLRLQAFALEATTTRLDARAGLQVYFLIRALLTLERGGRLAYIVSADICEGVFSSDLWRWICSRFKLDAIISFSPDAAPFPNVDTNAIVFLIQNATPNECFKWIKCNKRETDSLISVLFDDADPEGSEDCEVNSRDLVEALRTGLSRPPETCECSPYTLGQYAAVMRGIVTGDNDFFFLTQKQAADLGIPQQFLVRALGRTRDVTNELLTLDDMECLDRAGRPTYLLNVNGYPFDELPVSVQKYLLEGEARGLPNKTLIKTRSPWYRMETRKIPPILFAYLGRRNTRFIRNLANVVPLTCLLCVYPRHSDARFVKSLWNVLSHPDTMANLAKVGKSYGGGAIKVEPRALERLPLPVPLVHAEGLDNMRVLEQTQLEFYSE